MALTDMSAQQIAEAVRRGDLSAEEVVEASLARIAEWEPRVGAFLHVAAESAREQARRLDRQDSERRRHGRLAGVPVAIKDNIVTRDMPTTAASRILEGFRPPYNATVVERLLREGAVVIGKTNCDEFGMGSSTEHSAFQTTRHPEDPERVAGGSSGGSAAAVAMGACPVALGSDTGGSVRQPAAFCGVVGMKPTYGRVPRYGLIAYASSLDQIGPLTRTVADAALTLEVIMGFDPRDATSIDVAPPALVGEVGGDLSGLTIGLPEEYFPPELDGGIRSAVEAAVDRLREAGARVKPVRLPHTRYAIATYYLIAPAEASSNLARYDGVRYGWRAPAGDITRLYEETRGQGFGPEVKRRIMLGTHALSAGYYDAYYLKAQKVRTLIREDFRLAFAEVDALVTPTAPEVAFRLGEKAQDPLSMYLSDIFTVTANLAGLPAISVPCGRSRGLPVGLQVLAPPLGEAMAIRVASWVERTRGGAA